MLTAARCLDVDLALKAVEAAKLVDVKVEGVGAVVDALKASKGYLFAEASTAPAGGKSALAMSDAEYADAIQNYTGRRNSAFLRSTSLSRAHASIAAREATRQQAPTVEQLLATKAEATSAGELTDTAYRRGDHDAPPVSKAGRTMRKAWDMHAHLRGRSTRRSV
jgi:hypothetical protein